ncbi:MAG: amidohydrolase [Dehalococcoidia bacterium]|nr:amidohydrolase [Dehalococcoidia bacterium]
MPDRADLVLYNANVITLDRRRPRAQAVAVRGDVIVGVGNLTRLEPLCGPDTRRIDCQGMTLLPGFVDAHCHLLALAASLTGVDCRPQVVTSIAALQHAIRIRAQQTPAGRWVRGFGYDELSLGEGRHPTRHDLDSAAPHYPVRLDHRSGHAVVLNSAALAMAGITQETPDPPEGVIQRDPPTGQPTGLLLELGEWLRERLGTLRDAPEMDEGVRRMESTLLGWGITSVQDAGPGNGLARWEAFRAQKDSGRLRCRVTMMAGCQHIPELQRAGLGFGSGDDSLRLGHAKLMLTLTTGQLHPAIKELRQAVALAHRAGFPVAIHAIEQEAVAAAAAVLGDQPTLSRSSPLPQRGVRGDFPRTPAQARDRIEHCAECPPALLTEVLRCGATVVTQPGFIYWNGDAYQQRVASELLPHLYPIAALRRAGVPVAFGSDAPVVDPNPWPAIYSAVTRRTSTGQQLPGQHSGEVTVAGALEMHSLQGAEAEGAGDGKGSIEAGKLADLVLVENDPTGMDPAGIIDLRAVITIIGGQVVWKR